MTRPSPRIALAALSGLLGAAAHPPFGAWPLVFLFPIPLFFALRPDGPGEGRRNLAAGFAAGLGFWLPVVFWVTHTMRYFGGLPWIAAIPLWVFMASLLAAWVAGAAWVCGRVLRFGEGRALLAFPVIWIAQEWVRSLAFSGFPWALDAHALVAAPRLLWPSTLGGPYFLGLLVAAVPAALAGAVRFLGDRRSAVSLAALVAIATMFVPGFVRWAKRRSPGLARPASIRVLVVQPGVPQGVRWNAAARFRIFEELLEQTRTAAREAQPDLIAWPESAVPFDFDLDDFVRGPVLDLARETGASILLNTVRAEEGSDVYRNSARVVRPDGSVSVAYDKRHLVPFGEYVPAKWAFGWAGKIVRDIGDFSPAASEPKLLPVPFRPDGSEEPFDAEIGLGICYEAVFPDLFRDETRAGAKLLVTLTNDGWYGGLGAEEQHWNGAVASAVANGRSLVRAAVTGISGIVLPDGEVVRSLPLGASGALVHEVPLEDEPPPSVAARDSVAWGALALAAALAALPRRKVGSAPSRA